MLWPCALINNDLSCNGTRCHPVMPNIVALNGLIVLVGNCKSGAVCHGCNAIQLYFCDHRLTMQMECQEFPLVHRSV